MNDPLLKTTAPQLLEKFKNWCKQCTETATCPSKRTLTLLAHIGMTPFAPRAPMGPWGSKTIYRTEF